MDAGCRTITSYESSPGFGLQFCSQCGSTLCGTHNATVHGVTLGCLNENPDITIGYHIYVGSKADWEALPSGAKTYVEGLQSEN